MTLDARRQWLAVLVLLAALAASRGALAQSATQAPGANGCLTCHRGLPDGRTSTPAALFSQVDIHRESGFGCVDCHGGDTSADIKERAHAATRGFRGRPTGQALVAACSRCHSDAELMRRYSPRQRVDQATEFATSVHGKRLATGDPVVATCVSCHGAHGIRTVRDAKSPVYPTNVAATCATCHASAARMRGYTLPDGSPLPIDQLSQYEKSVHHIAMVKGNDLSAPTCNDCHGNHGAAPPGVGAVAYVCGTCHAVFAQRFEKSVHRELFDKGCVECHGNHAVLQPTDAMLGTDTGAVCASCHSEADDKGAQTAAKIRAGIEGLKTRLNRSAELVARIRNAGMEVSAQELAIAEARTRLTLARTEMHASDVALVDSVLAEGLKLADQVDQAGEQSLAELAFRRRGLAVSLVAILLVVVALAFKVRQIERRQESR
jgi:predicted CXXCH cytochrome family protein